MRTLTIIGAGRAGGAVALALMRAGFSLEAVITGKSGLRADLRPHIPETTRIESADEAQTISSDLVIIAVPDDRIETVAQWLSLRLRSSKAVFHLSGALTASVLAPISDRGVLTGSLHPLISIADPVSGAESFSKAFFGVEGSDDACQIAIALVERLGGRFLRVTPEKKVLYHAAAVMAAGHLAALADAAFEAMQTAVDAGTDSREVLLPLIESVISNLHRMSAVGALTGPVTRGDAETVSRHIQALAACDSNLLLKIYLILAERSIEMIQRNRPGSQNLLEIAEKLNIAKQNTA